MDNLSREADDQIQREWKALHAGEGAPFGALRRGFREDHCATLNPYGSDDCPYTKTACVLAFLASVQRTMTADEPIAHFRVFTRELAARRADDKPLARDRETKSDQPDLDRGLAAGGPEGRTGDLGSDDLSALVPDVAEAAEAYLHRRIARPVHVSAVLGVPDRRPRPEAGRVEGPGPERSGADGGDVQLPQRGSPAQP